jgi:predicted RNase H-like nuclease (RuvC/YqgF family)
MKIPPESFHIFREELRKEKLEKERLRAEYEHRIGSLGEELNILKEQIDAQSDMIKRTIDYAIRLEKELASFKNKVAEDKRNSKRSFH